MTYIISTNPETCAEALDDRTLDTACVVMSQVICTALGGAQYISEMCEDPFVIWIKASQSNATWAIAYGVSLCMEHAKRFASLNSRQDDIEECYKRIGTLPDTRVDQSEGSKEKFFPKDWPIEHVRSREALQAMWDSSHSPVVWSNRSPPVWSKAHLFHKREVFSTPPNQSSKYTYEFLAVRK